MPAVRPRLDYPPGSGPPEERGKLAEVRGPVVKLERRLLKSCHSPKGHHPATWVDSWSLLGALSSLC